VRCIVCNIFIDRRVEVDKKYEIVSNQFKIRYVLIAALRIKMGCLNHELCEEVHPRLKVDMPYAVERPREIIHA
jgi:hypothetical protein